MKQKTRIMIYILIAAAVVIMGILALLSNKNGTPSADKHIELGQSYLIELSYDKAVLEFTQAIEIDPKSPEAYIGLAETYIGLGDIEKAVETLERGLAETADEKIKALLDELIDETEKKMTADITTAFVSEPPVITTAETRTSENKTEVEDEEKYDEDGSLLYKKKKIPDGYELYWYFRNKVHVIESYDKNDKLTYSKVYGIESGEILAEGKAKQTENGYIINGKTNDNGCYYDYELNEMRNVIYSKWDFTDTDGTYVCETWYNSNEKPISQIQTGEDWSAEFTYADGYVKTYKTYSNGKLILYTEYETDERDKARKENIYDDDELICVHYYDSNDTLRKQITYMDDGTEYITYFDEYGNYIPDY